MLQHDYVIVLLEYAGLSIMLTFKKIIRETSEYPEISRRVIENKLIYTLIQKSVHY